MKKLSPSLNNALNAPTCHTWHRRDHAVAVPPPERRHFRCYATRLSLQAPELLRLSLHTRLQLRESPPSFGKNEANNGARVRPTRALMSRCTCLHHRALLGRQFAHRFVHRFRRRFLRKFRPGRHAAAQSRRRIRFSP